MPKKENNCNIIYLALNNHPIIKKWLFNVRELNSRGYAPDVARYALEYFIKNGKTCSIASVCIDGFDENLVASSFQLRTCGSQVIQGWIRDIYKEEGNCVNTFVCTILEASITQVGNKQEEYLMDISGIKKPEISLDYIKSFTLKNQRKSGTSARTADEKDNRESESLPEKPLFNSKSAVNVKKQKEEVREDKDINASDKPTRQESSGSFDLSKLAGDRARVVGLEDRK